MNLNSPEGERGIEQEMEEIPKDFARAFGKGIQQKFGGDLRIINSEIKRLIKNFTNPDFPDDEWHKRIQDAHENANRMEKDIGNMQTSKKVVIVRLSCSSWDLDFSDEKEEVKEIPPTQNNPIILGGDLVPKFTAAFNNLLRDPITKLVSFSSLMERIKDPSVRSSSEKIAKATFKISAALDPYLRPLLKISINVGDDGNIKINPIPRSRA